MKNTFYYPEPLDLKECARIMEKMESDLSETSYSKEEAKEYAEKMIADARPLSKQNPDCLYYGFDNPEHMPSDCRVHYFYMPTYMATAMMMKIAVKYPELLDGVKGYKETFIAASKGCIGRQFMGSTYEERKGILDALTFFLKGDAGIFLRDNGDWCKDFCNQFFEALNFTNQFILTGKVWDGFGTKITYEDRAKEIIRTYNMQMGYTD